MNLEELKLLVDAACEDGYGDITVTINKGDATFAEVASFAQGTIGDQPGDTLTLCSGRNKVFWIGRISDNSIS